MGAIPPVVVFQNHSVDSIEIADVCDAETLWKLHCAIIVTDRCESASLIGKTSGRTSRNFSIQFSPSGRN